MQFKIKTFLILFMTCMLVLMNMNVRAQSPLPAEQAFIFSSSILKSNLVMVEWQVAPGYYLYSKRMHFKLLPDVSVNIQKPQGDLKYDPNFGRQEVLSRMVRVPIHFKEDTQQIELNITYQGCSEDGFCYPPMQKKLLVNFADNTILQQEQALPTTTGDISLGSLLTNQHHISNLLNANHFGFLLLIFLGLGLLLSFTPCCLPMVPILTSIIVGQNRATISAKKAFLLSLFYVIGSALTYAIAGLMAASMGSSLQVYLQKPIIIAFVSGFFVLLAFSLFGWYELKLPARFQKRLTNLSNELHSGNFLAVFAMGILSTLIVSPCVTAPLVGVLIYIAQTGDQVLGASALFAMGIGMGIPLLLIGTSAGKWLPRSGPWMEVVKIAFGFLMLGMSIWLSMRITSPSVSFAFWGVLLILIAFFVGTHLPKAIGYQKFNRLLGVLLGTFGIIVMVGASLPNKMPAWMVKQQISITKNSFIVIHDINDLKRELALAQAEGKPVLLDFYADWCESCITMDKNVFAAPDVRRELSHYVLLRADLTVNNVNDQAIMKYFNVIAPPTILFFDTKGQEMNSKRIVGEVNAKEFIARLTL